MNHIVHGAECSLVELLEECLASRTAERWELFIKRVQPPITSSIWRTLTRVGTPPQDNRALIDDLVQQTFLRMCEGEFRVLRRLKGSTEAGLLAYLRTIAAHIAVDHLRRRGPGTEELEDDSGQAATDPDDSAVLLAEIDRHLRRCSEENFRRDRRVFWLYHRTGVTAKAIAALPGINLSVKGVESLILRLTRCLRKLFAGTPEAGGISSQITSSMKGRVIGTVS